MGVMRELPARRRATAGSPSMAAAKRAFADRPLSDRGIAIPTLSSPPGVGANPTYQSAPTCISPWSVRSGMPV
jgi:hypothetical protein